MSRFASAINSTKIQLPGLMITITIGLAAAFLGEHYAAPVMLFALLLGMSFNFLANDAKNAPGLEFASTHLLRIGVALLGARITLGQLQDLGWFPLVATLLMMLLVILVGVVLGRILKTPNQLGLLTGGAVAICGASAAAAIAAVLPLKSQSGRALALTIIGITALSTTAMVLYPLVAPLFNLNPEQTGYFLGTTIHDVAQVVGAGYSVSEPVGDTATLVKLFRVAMMVPLVFVVAIVSRDPGQSEKTKLPIPGFLIAFIVLVLINSMGWLPARTAGALSDLSRWCLIFAITAIGARTALGEVTKLGIAPVILLVTETLVLLACGIGAALWV